MTLFEFLSRNNETVLRSTVRPSVMNTDRLMNKPKKKPKRALKSRIIHTTRVEIKIEERLRRFSSMT